MLARGMPRQGLAASLLLVLLAIPLLFLGMWLALFGNVRSFRYRFAWRKP
ncbi:MAG: hypothetical protein CM15mP120_19820 [Pseudomonadota bacterium]|nr:MAG: hypothetical protein CM15mP120_19820 [Pseudomonadota bacterium]